MSSVCRFLLASRDFREALDGTRRMETALARHSDHASGEMELTAAAAPSNKHGGNREAGEDAKG